MQKDKNDVNAEYSLHGKQHSANYIKHKTTTPEVDDFLGNLESLLQNKQGEWIGPETQSPWLRPFPIGFRRLLKWISTRYNRPTIYVTENGTSVKGENDLSKEEILADDFRVQYFDGYIRAMADARALDGVDVRGYMAWSLMDNFEWAEGFETRFGVTYVDYKGGQKRYPKKSAKAIGDIFDSLIEQ